MTALFCGFTVIVRAKETKRQVKTNLNSGLPMLRAQNKQGKDARSETRLKARIVCTCQNEVCVHKHDLLPEKQRRLHKQLSYLLCRICVIV